MDWDGIGTFALFMSSGAVGVGMILLRAYKAKLTAKVEMARLEAAARDSNYAQEHVRDLEEQIRQLNERVDFNERLVAGGEETTEE